MGQIWVDVEENPNSEYLPMRVFETQGAEKVAAAIRVSEVSGGEGPHEIVGWSSDGGGTPTNVTYAPVTDSGAAVSILIVGGDFGIRMRPAGDGEGDGAGKWSTDNGGQRGEPYLLLPPEVEIVVYFQRALSMDPIRLASRLFVSISLFVSHFTYRRALQMQGKYRVMDT